MFKILNDNGKNRGVLINLEGIDRSGKSTQALKLFDSLKLNNIKVILKRFPDRSTKIGELLDLYLQSKIDLESHVAHLLFSANRWECQDEIRKTLNSGTSVILDRYALSGLAYSIARDLDYDWCCSTELGLIRPDICIFLEITSDDVKHRQDYGKERDENELFQKKVSIIYNNRLLDPVYCKIINANRDIDDIHDDIKKLIMDHIENETFKDRKIKLIKENNFF
jgi:dTMP kinase